MDYTMILCIFNISLFVIDKTFNTFTIQIKHWQNIVIAFIVSRNYPRLQANCSEFSCEFFL